MNGDWYGWGPVAFLGLNMFWMGFFGLIGMLIRCPDGVASGTSCYVLGVLIASTIIGTGILTYCYSNLINMSRKK